MAAGVGATGAPEKAAAAPASPTCLKRFRRDTSWGALRLSSTSLGMMSSRTCGLDFDSIVPRPSSPHARMRDFNSAGKADRIAADSVLLLRISGNPIGLAGGVEITHPR